MATKALSDKVRYKALPKKETMRICYHCSLGIPSLETDDGTFVFYLPKKGILIHFHGKCLIENPEELELLKDLIEETLH